MTTSTSNPDDAGWRRPPPTHDDFRRDAILAAAMLVGALVSLGLYSVTGIFRHAAPMWVGVIWAFVIITPLAWRRRAPSVAAFIIAATFVTGAMLPVPEGLFANIALFLALYSVGAWVANRQHAFIVRVIIIAGMFIWLIAAMFVEATNPDATPGLSRAGAFSPYVAFQLAQIMLNLLYFGAAYYFGERSYAAARERAALELRTRELSAERERTARQAVALERLRIARELHDVVAHHVSVMGVQAGAARTVLDVDRDAAREALASVETGARSAIDELHKMLGTLRAHTDEAGENAEASTLGVRHLGDLTDGSTASGLPTRYEVIGEAAAISPVISLNLYRITQEALTNARKYGGSSATAEVRLRYLDGAVELEITNTGNVPSTARAGGLGIIGMRERVEASGGRFEARPRTRGGYLVRAHIPSDQETAR
ncbi:sensor histidine kinase [Plantibacter sp. Mn2098]|uniref:sensor histidine kinase n=1 Tax=Plantibacter sp. Mn2098 TaxID=3395266 RepID=UPI003BDAD304